VIFGLAASIFIWLPMVIVVSTSISTLDYVTFPPVGFTLKWYEEILRKPEFIDSFTLSLRIAGIATIIVGTFGSLAGIAVARYAFPGRDALRMFFLSPLLLPSLVFSLALLQFYAMLHLRANVFTLAAGHLIITTPYLVRLVILAAVSVDSNLERAAQTLGASPRQAFMKVTLPLIRPGILAGLTFVFIVSFDEVAVSLLNSSPGVVTLPIRIYNYIEQIFDPFITAVGTTTMVLAAIAIMVIERFFGLDKLFGLGGGEAHRRG